MKNTLITENTVILDLNATSKTDAIHQLCGHLFMLKKTVNPLGLYSDIIEREDIVSTYAGTLTAIPHAISANVDEPVLCFARVQSDDMTWNADDEVVRFIFLLSAPKTDDLKLLRLSQSHVFSAIAQLLMRPEVIDRWLTTQDKSDILDSLMEALDNNRTITMQ